ncbi:hypothetical protein [Terrisporobacter sp.]|uniref:hypothetical protein n=1 Tax=Terrisporobacter sp. TaxID=1965305 RepID=UPI0026236AB5|nr:hypothetical protein [Terrisporobacter sp.]
MFCEIAESELKDNCKSELIAYKLKKNVQNDEVSNIRMIFSCKIAKLNNKGNRIEEYSYIPIEIDLLKKIMICKVAPKTNIIDDMNKPVELYAKYTDKVIDMFDIQINSYNSIHKKALYNMSESLYSQVYEKVISNRSEGLDDLIDKFAIDAKSKVNIDNIDTKIKINNLFDIKSYLKNILINYKLQIY